MTAEENGVNPQEPKENEEKLLEYELAFLHLCNVLENIISGARHAQKMAETLYVSCEAATIDCSECDEYDKMILKRLKKLTSYAKEAEPKN